MSLIFTHTGGPLTPGDEETCAAGVYFWDREYNPTGPFATVEACKVAFRAYNDQHETMDKAREDIEDELGAELVVEVGDAAHS